MRENFEVISKNDKTYYVRCKLCGRERAVARSTYKWGSFSCDCEKMIKRKCESCGKTFESISKTAKFCSARCRNRETVRRAQMGASARKKADTLNRKVTKTTRMLICVYTAEGLSIAEICGFLKRNEETVKNILEECRVSGEYDMHIGRSPYCKMRNL